LGDKPAGLAEALSDRYVLEHELGRGGMATVYLARDLKHERAVALKVLRPELATTLGPERFLREIRTAARLQHPHILPVHDSGVAGGQLWYTMPYVEGESLRELLRREPQLPIEQVVRIGREVAEALDYAHRHGVVHRDIKPENILLSDGQPLVADFGVAKAVDAAGGERLTGTGMALGTPAYMSPEQAAGSGTLDGRSDQYSLACMLYEMLAGEPPFTGPTPQAVIGRRFVEPPPPLRTMRGSLPEPLEHVVLRALAREPVDRFSSTAEFAQAFNTASLDAAGSPHAATKVSTPPNRRLLLLGFVTLLGLGALAMALLQYSRSGATKLDANLLAVAPFDVLDPALQLWHEGMVDVLARNLDGAGPLRTVSPIVIVRRWRGRADPASAAALGRRTGAKLAVYGTLIRSGADSVRLSATVLDAARERAVGELEVRGALTDMDRLTDSLAVGILREIARTRPVGAIRRIGLGARSLPALKAFLQAEQYFRQGSWDSAKVYAEQAVALDTGFALAYNLLGSAIGFQINRPPETDPTINHVQAGARNHGLPPRDSLLILADSLRAGLWRSNRPNPSRDAPSPAVAARLFAVLERTVQEYPEDPRAWYELGESRYHFGGWLVPSGGWRSTLAAFERSITTDSLFGPGYIHAVELGYAMGDTAHAHRLMAAAVRADPHCTQCPAYRVVRKLEALDSVAQERVLDTLSADLLRVIYVTLARWPDPGELPVRVLRHLRPLDRPWADSHITVPLALRGHLRETIAFEDTTTSPSRILFAEAALLGSVSAKRASTAFDSWLEERSFWSVLALPWWSSRQDTFALRRFLRLVESVTLPQRSSTHRSPDDSAWSAQVTTLARAHLALAESDTAAALQAYTPLLLASCPWWCQADQLMMARLLAARGRLADAVRILNTPSTLESDLALAEPRPSDVLWYLERGRVAERLGDRARAVEAYRYVSAIWRNADREVQPYVTEARGGLARLTAEPARETQ
jgi:serine/threonine-protein kinase